MALRFLAESQYHGTVKPDVDHLAHFIAWLLEHGLLLVLDVDGCIAGMFGAAIVPHMFSGELTANEVVWWVDPEYRGGSHALRMLRWFDEWAADRGAKRQQMVAPFGEARLHDVYQRLGYAPLETVYQRELLDDVRTEPAADGRAA